MTKKKTNKTLDDIKKQVVKAKAEGFVPIGITYDVTDEYKNAVPQKADAGTDVDYAMGEVGSIGYEQELDKAMANIASKVNPDASMGSMFEYAPPPKSEETASMNLFERTVIPVEHPKVGTAGKGYIPWGPSNALPNFIYRTAWSLPYTSRSLEFLRDAIVGLGCEFMYRWTRTEGGTVVTKEIPYADAGMLLRQRIMELEAERTEREKQTIRTSDYDRDGNPKPGTLSFEIRKLQQDYETWERVNTEVKEFERNNNIHKHELACMSNYVAMDMYFPMIGLSRGKPGEDWQPKIVSLSHIDCVAARLEQMDADRRINYVYHSDKWRGNLGFKALVPELNEIVAYPALDEMNLWSELSNIVTSKRKVGVRSRPTWFCIPRKMPGMNSLYYAVPHWWSIYSSAVYDYAATIIADRAASRMNATMWGKIIMVNHLYLEHLWARNGCDTPEKKKALRKQLKKNIDDFLRNRRNNGSTAMFESVVAPDGSTLWDSIKIIDVPVNANTVTANKTELSEISNVIFLAMGIHSMLMGNDIQAGSSTGGTVQRELDLLKTKQVAPRQKDYLDLLNFIRDWNMWDPEHGLWRGKHMSLTTLDASKTGTTTVNNEGEKTS